MSKNTIRDRARAFVAAYVAPSLAEGSPGRELHLELVTGAAMAMLLDATSSTWMGELLASEELRAELEADNEQLRRQLDAAHAELEGLRAWRDASIDFVAIVRECGALKEVGT